MTIKHVRRHRRGRGTGIRWTCPMARTSLVHRTSPMKIGWQGNCTPMKVSDASDFSLVIGQVRWPWDMSDDPEWQRYWSPMDLSDGSDKSDDFALEIFVWPRNGNFALSLPPLHTFVSLLIVRLFLYSRFKIKYYELHSWAYFEFHLEALCHLLFSLFVSMHLIIKLCTIIYTHAH